MSAFQTILHVLRQDLRRFRFFILAFAILHVIAVLVERAPLPRGMGEGLFGVCRVLQMLGLLLLTAQACLADSAAHTRSQWWTRPIGIGTLLCAKFAYIVVTLWLPLLAIYVVAWIQDGFTLRQIILGAGEVTLYSFALCTVSAGIASAAPSFWSFVARIGIAVAGLTFVIWMSRMLRTRGEAPDWAVSPGGFAFLLCMGIIVGGIVALATVYILRRPAWSLMGIAFVCTLPLWMPGIRTAVVDDSGPNSQITITSPLPDETPASMPVRNIAFHGLAANEFAWPIAGKFTFKDAGGTEATFEIPEYRHNHNRHSNQFVDASFPAIRAQLGDGIQYQLGRRGYNRRGLRTSGHVPGIFDAETPGILSGDLRYLLFETVYVGELAYRRGGACTHGGHSIQIIEIRDHRGDQIELLLRSRSPNLLWSPEIDDRVAMRSRPWSTWVLALVTAEGEAQIIQPQLRSSTGGPFPVTVQSNVQTEFDTPHSGIHGEKPPTIHAFRVIAKGLHGESFALNNHTVDLDRRAPQFAALPGEGSTSNVIESIESLDSLAALDSIKDDIPYEEHEKAASKMADLVAADVIGALKRVPWRYPLHESLVDTLKKELTEDHIDELAAALERDPRLIDVVDAKQWGDQFKDYVATQLATRNPSLERALVRVAARYKDPALAEDLRWQFIHNDRLRRENLYPMLADLSGFGGRETLLQAWNRARFHKRGSMWLLGLNEGLPGAMDTALRLVLNEGIPRQERNSGLLQNLRRLTNHTGAWREFYPWFLENASTLEFDSESGKWRVTP